MITWTGGNLISAKAKVQCKVKMHIALCIGKSQVPPFLCQAGMRNIITNGRYHNSIITNGRYHHGIPSNTIIRTSWNRNRKKSEVDATTNYTIASYTRARANEQPTNGTNCQNVRACVRRCECTTNNACV